MKTILPKLVVWGASGHAKVIADIIQLNGDFQIVGYLDDVNSNCHGQTFYGYPILGGKEQLDKLLESGIEHIIIGVGNCHARYTLSKLVHSRGFKFTNAIHPRSIIARDVCIGEGSVTVAGAVVNPGSKLGKHVIVNTCASVGHDCTIQDAVHIAPGVRVGGHSTIGEKSWIGIGSALRDHVTIGKNCIIGAGTVVIKDIPDNVLAYGVPAKIIKTIDPDTT